MEKDAPAGSDLGSLAWPDIAARAESTVLAVPVGSTEQHGPHLPLSTDTDIALALCSRLAEVRSDVVVAPAIAYGSSGEHAGFPGTLSIGQQVLEDLLVELGRSADCFAAMMLVSAHGGNAEPVARAVQRLRSESRRVGAWSPRCTDPCDSHAGRLETSILLAVESPAVRMDLAAAGESRRIETLMPALRSKGMAAVSPNGVLGNPTTATPELGAELLVSWIEDLDSATQRLLEPA